MSAEPTPLELLESAASLMSQADQEWWDGAGHALIGIAKSRVDRAIAQLSNPAWVEAREPSSLADDDGKYDAPFKSHGLSHGEAADAEWGDRW